ncbi:hypothetical protein KCU71_g3034, partial [Aureobasidium melanogenum]
MLNATCSVKKGALLLQTPSQTPGRHFEVHPTHRFELAATSECMSSNRPTGFLDLPVEIRLKIYHLVLADFLDHSIMVSSSIHVRPPGSSLVPPITPTVKHRRQIALPASVNRVHEPAIARSTKTIRAEVLPLLYAPGTPVSYTFHSCSTSLIRRTLHRIHAEDIPLKFQLGTLIFSLPKELDDNGLAITWLVSLTLCLAWCLHATSSDPEIVITEPELRVGDPYVAVNETQSSSLPLKRAEFTIATNALPRGTDAGLATTATELVTSFLEFTLGLPTEEMDTEEQVVFAFADFLHAREDKCKNCILWRSVWKECLRRIYGAEVVKNMAKERKFELHGGLGG